MARLYIKHEYVECAVTHIHEFNTKQGIKLAANVPSDIVENIDPCYVCFAYKGKVYAGHTVRYVGVRDEFSRFSCVEWDDGLNTNKILLKDMIHG